MNILWGILNLLFGIGLFGTCSIYGLAMFAMAHDSPNGPEKSLKYFAWGFLILTIVGGGLGAFYLLKNAYYYFTL